MTQATLPWQKVRPRPGRAIHLSRTKQQRSSPKDEALRKTETEGKGLQTYRIGDHDFGLVNLRRSWAQFRPADTRSPGQARMTTRAVNHQRSGGLADTESELKRRDAARAKLRYDAEEGTGDAMNQWKQRRRSMTSTAPGGSKRTTWCQAEGNPPDRGDHRACARWRAVYLSRAPPPRRRRSRRPAGGTPSSRKAAEVTPQRPTDGAAAEPKDPPSSPIS